jgi:hypothetical protein
MVEFQTVFAKLEEEERSEEQTPGIASVPKPCSADEEDEDRAGEPRRGFRRLPADSAPLMVELNTWVAP